jgi:ribosomal protein L25 (general stress protein Ctc)
MTSNEGLLADLNLNICTEELCENAAGIIVDTNQSEYIRFQLRTNGRVPAQVYGTVSAGDYLVNYDGRLRKATEAEESTKAVVARALEGTDVSGMILVSVWL